MYAAGLDQPADFAGFRDLARRLVLAGVPPEQVVWRESGERELFGTVPPPDAAGALDVPRAFVRLAEDVICHRDPERLALLYQALWRIARGERALLAVASEPLVHRLERMAKAVRRDLHKMHAFVRFRSVAGEDGERFIAWFEPEHHILDRAAPFFVDRFAAMRWSILTPIGSLHWDGASLSFGPAVGREQAPSGDALDGWWRDYYQAVFNPARVNPQAMRAEMPKKYWRNLPEATLIPTLLEQAGSRTRAMLEAEPPAPRERPWRTVAREAAAEPGALGRLQEQAAVCERCPLHAGATQTVFGEGPADAPVVLVGEQPGDQEDLAGRPFVGPAGRLLDRALDAAGIDRRRLYLTNAVKHFKFAIRGKRRLHQTPGRYEIEHCRWWLEQELTAVRPQLAVALGATAARALLGRDVAVRREQGGIVRSDAGVPSLITVHPSYLLRLPDPRDRSREYDRFVADLDQVASLVPAVRAFTPPQGAAES